MEQITHGVIDQLKLSSDSTELAESLSTAIATDNAEHTYTSNAAGHTRPASTKGSGQPIHRKTKTRRSNLLNTGRTRCGDDGGASDDEDEEGSCDAVKNGNGLNTRCRYRPLACPFYVHNPDEHISCAGVSIDSFQAARFNEKLKRVFRTCHITPTLTDWQHIQQQHWGTMTQSSQQRFIVCCRSPSGNPVGKWRECFKTLFWNGEPLPGASIDPCKLGLSTSTTMNPL